MNRSLYRIAYCAVTASLLAGCIPIPLPNPEPYRETTIGDLVPGASRADVVFALGAPYWSHQDDRVFVYASDEHKLGMLFLLGNGTAGGVAAATIGKRHLLVIEFGESGRVEQIEALNLGVGTSYGPSNEIGFEDVVCTSWNLCLAWSGAYMVSPEVVDRQ